MLWGASPIAGSQLDLAQPQDGGGARNPSLGLSHLPLCWRVVGEGTVPGPTHKSSSLPDPPPLPGMLGAPLPAPLSPSHVQDGRSHLRVFIEAVLPDGRVDATRDVTLICPKPGHTWTPDAHLAPHTGFSLPTPQARPLHPTPEHGLVRATPTLPSLRPGPTTHPTQAPPQWGTLEHWGGSEPPYPGM